MARLDRARWQRGEDHGFTIVETLVALLVVSVVIPIGLAFVSNMFQQSQDVHDTMTGVQQDQVAGEVLLQYLHATIVVLPGSTATTLNASVLAGVNSSTPQTATLQATLTPPTSPSLDATFTTSLTPNTGPNAWKTTSIGTYDAVNTSTVFTYYYVSSTGLAPLTALTNAELSEVVAVGIDVTFLAGPHKPTYGFHAVHASNFETTIYLQNSAGAPAPTTMTTITGPTGTVAAGSPLTVTATVSPTPTGSDQGLVTFTVTLSGSPLADCTSPVDVAATSDAATCTFTPATGGTYDVTAAFSGTDLLEPSTSVVDAIVVLTPTTITINNVTVPSSGTLSINVTVGPVGVTGQVSFNATQNSCSYHCQNGIDSETLSSGTATGRITGLQHGSGYTVTATYTGNSTYGASSPATWPNTVTP